jgi:hypothetical protein
MRRKRSAAAEGVWVVVMSAKYGVLVMVATACINLLTVVTTTAAVAPAIKIVELTLAVAAIAFLMRANRYGVFAFVLAASTVVANQMLLGYGYLTFLNAGQAFSASAFGMVPASGAIGAIVGAITVPAFFVRRTWAYVTVIVLLIAATWPTPLADFSI